MALPDISLKDGELVDDRALGSASDDQFRHADFADELTELVCKVPTPSNVALFAPWGSGKTGLGNLLGANLDGRKGVRFARFDAFKYAEFPLRRHFISQVAKSLGHTEEHFSDDLYRQLDKREIRFSKEEQVKLAVAFLKTLGLVALVLFALAAVVALVIAGLHHSRFSTEFSHAISDYLLATVPVAAVITTFVQLATGGLTVNSTRSAPSGEEEFERVFRQLVDKVGADRLVIFIDELDRCSPEQVVSTLETIKTFLEVPGCIFVVAADLQVLEQALRKKARQETPLDATNPYYSAGSSYLDKVFQYQIALPPLKPRRLTAFALDLVSDRPGMWQRVDNLAEVISVLIPTHVTSPRRVKVLLNSFAITYRLAELRARDGLLAANLSTRANEVAKLVCLRCEFPLFADDLVLDQRLPQLVRALADGDELPPHVNAEVAARAKAYAKGLLAVGDLLVEEAPEHVPDGATDETPATPPVDTVAPATPAEAGTPPAISDTSSEIVADSDQSVQREYALQLVRYLRKVEHIPGPGADLIYMESSGASVDLDAAIADDLERAAIDGEIGTVVSTVASLTPDKQRSAVTLLAELVREAPVGIEGQNAVSTLLSTITQTHVDLQGIADTVADAVAGHQARVELREQDRAGALTLALASNRSVGEHLRDGVLRAEGAMEQVDVALIVVAGAEKIPDRFDDALGLASTEAFLQATDDFVGALLGLPDEQMSRVLARTRGPLKDAVAEFKAQQQTDEITRAGAGMGTLLDAALDAERPAVITAVCSMSLSVDASEFRQPVASRLSRLGTVSNPELARLMLAGAPTWTPEFWPTWLAALDVSVVAKLDEAPRLMGDAATRLWRNIAATQDADELAKQQAGLSALEQLTAGGVSVRPDELVAAVAEQLTGPFSDDATAQGQQTILQDVGRFVAAQLVSAQAVADIDLACCAATLRAALHPQLPQGEVGPAVYRRVSESAPHASLQPLDDTRDAVVASPWLPAHRRDVLLIALAAARHGLDAATEAPFSAEEVRALRAQHGQDFDEGLAVWLVTFAQNPADVWTAVQTIAGETLSDTIVTALRTRSDGLSARQKYELAQPALDDALTAPVDPSFLRAVRFSEADSRAASAKLIELAHAAATIPEQVIVLNLWQALSPTGDANRKSLIENIYMPLIGLGPEGVDAAVEHFGLVSAAASDSRRSIRDALKEQAGDEEQKRRVDARLYDAGWQRRSMFGLLPPVDVDE